jgi:hypothetical protein
MLVSVSLPYGTVNRISHGNVTFGRVPAPIQIYEGPTARKRIKSDTAAAFAASPDGGPTALGKSGRQDTN